MFVYKYYIEKAVYTLDVFWQPVSETHLHFSNWNIPICTVVFKADSCMLIKCIEYMLSKIIYEYIYKIFTKKE